jgi:hypothetical protein
MFLTADLTPAALDFSRKYVKIDIEAETLPA